MEYRIVLPEDTEDLAAAMKKAYLDEPWKESWTDEKAVRRIWGIMSNFESFGIKAVEADAVVAGYSGLWIPMQTQISFLCRSCLSCRNGRGKESGKRCCQNWKGT